MIKGFRCADTRALFETGKSRRFSNLVKAATRKLAQLDAASTLEFLRSPPGNRLEALAGDRKGQYSIRVNDQFRLCFRWTAEGPTDVEMVDYH
ncbi:MAG TPA: type II toxin-antitoxin system RelE/ParE family toxin [Steroidobacteraceae bacterium]|nr:type II toxin-antitoxin system RelE/ParE family toxin [Steroidobacteraceae bacterium]